MRFLMPLGRVLFVLIFLAAAPRHFTQEGIAHAASLGVPLAWLVVPISGVMAILGGLSVAFGYRIAWGGWLLVAFLGPVTLGMHAFWNATDPDQRHVQLAMFAKNVSMLGAALIVTQLSARRGADGSGAPG